MATISDKLADELIQLEKDAVDRGQLIEAGWIGLRRMALAPDAPDIQVEEMRNAFFAGAQHLFTSIMGVLDEGAEPTDNDMRRMSLIASELEAFIVDFSDRRIPTVGNG